MGKKVASKEKEMKEYHVCILIVMVYKRDKNYIYFKIYKYIYICQTITKLLPVHTR